MDDTQLDEALEEACNAFGLRGEDRFLVAALVERPARTWPACCGSGCVPCMDDIVGAAERVLLRLGKPVE